MKVAIAELKNVIKRTLTSTHYTDDQAEQIAEVLMYAEMSGKNTQGIIKLMGTEPIQNIQPQYAPKVIKDTKLSQLIDGGGNPGILVSHMATKSVIEKCREHGFGIVGTNNTYSSTGAIGFYASEMAKNNLIGIVMAGSPGGVAPHGGIEPLFGTNPIAFGLPTASEPLVFDMATAAITWYGLVRAKALGEELPQNVAIDSDGNVTADPEKAMEGAILPFDRNYKGSGLSMIIELLTTSLVATDTKEKKDWGNLFIAIDPELLISTEEFKKNNTALIQKVKQSKSQHGKNIYIPGEQANAKRLHAEKSGMVDVDETLLNDLKSKA